MAAARGTPRGPSRLGLAAERARWVRLCSAAGSVMGSRLTQEQVDDLRGESRWPPAIVLCVAIAVPLLLPDRFSLVSKWIEPALLALLLVAHIIADPGRIDRQSRATRMIGVGLLAVRLVRFDGLRPTITRAAKPWRLAMHLLRGPLKTFAR